MSATATKNLIFLDKKRSFLSRNIKFIVAVKLNFEKEDEQNPIKLICHHGDLESLKYIINKGAIVEMDTLYDQIFHNTKLLKQITGSYLLALIHVPPEVVPIIPLEMPNRTDALLDQILADHSDEEGIERVD